MFIHEHITAVSSDSGWWPIDFIPFQGALLAIDNSVELLLLKDLPVFRPDFIGERHVASAIETCLVPVWFVEIGARRGKQVRV